MLQSWIKNDPCAHFSVVRFVYSAFTWVQTDGGRKTSVGRSGKNKDSLSEQQDSKTKQKVIVESDFKVVLDLRLNYQAKASVYDELGMRLNNRLSSSGITSNMISPHIWLFIHFQRGQSKRTREREREREREFCSQIIRLLFPRVSSLLSANRTRELTHTQTHNPAYVTDNIYSNRQ